MRPKNQRSSALIIFSLMFEITLKSTNPAFKVHYLILVIILGSLASIAIAAVQGPMDNPIVWWGDFRGSPEHGFSGVSFWGVFAVFFPASTGIIAGVNMSGDLKNLRKSIPIGTLTAIGLSFMIYVAPAYRLMKAATIDELTENYTIMIDLAFWGPPVMVGLQGFLSNQNQGHYLQMKSYFQLAISFPGIALFGRIQKN